MRALRTRKKWVAAVIGVAVIGTVATMALASPPIGVIAPTNFVTADFQEDVKWNSDRVKFQTKDPTDVRVQRLDFAPGSFSGWHHHPGIVIVAVASGVVTHWDSKCNKKDYGPGHPNGAVFSEGGDRPTQASSAGGATVYVTYVAPNANPPVFRQEDDPPPCA